MTGPRVTLRIDRVVSDTAGLDRAALEAAIRAEISAILADRGVGAFGTGGARPLVEARLAGGSDGTAPARIARAAIGSIVT